MLQQQVTSLLAEINFNIHENFILPKCFDLVVLRFMHEERIDPLYGDGMQQHENKYWTQENPKFALDSSDNQFGQHAVQFGQTTSIDHNS